jgi:alanine racemase
VATTEIAKRAATRPTWAEVSLSALRQNYRTVADYVGTDVTVCAVVKADAYGHGALECALALEKEGASWLGVTSLDEAIPLREEGVSTRILLMTGFWRGEEEEIVRLRLTPTVLEVGQIELMERAAARLGVTQQPIHLKVDTGMGRLGVRAEGLGEALVLEYDHEHVPDRGRGPRRRSRTEGAEARERDEDRPDSPHARTVESTRVPVNREPTRR